MPAWNIALDAHRHRARGKCPPCPVPFCVEGDFEFKKISRFGGGVERRRRSGAGGNKSLNRSLNRSLNISFSLNIFRCELEGEQFF